MRPQVAGVEQSRTISFHQDGVGVVGRVIDEKRRDDKWAEADWLAIFKVDHPLQQQARRREHIGSSQDGLRCSTDQKWCFPGQSMSQAIMILMRVRDDDAKKIG